MAKRNYVSGFSLGSVAMIVVGGYAVWRNRFRIQRGLESIGINTPWMNRNLLDSVKSGAAKLTGSSEHGLKNLTHSNTGSKDFAKAI